MDKFIYTKELSFTQQMTEGNRKLFEARVKLDKGFEILNENDSCSHVLFLLKGEIEVFKISENGKLFRLYLIKEGESCVLNLSCVLSDINYMAYAKALTDIECVLLPRNIFLKVFQEEESLRNYVFQLISTRLIQITSKVEGMVLDSLETRLEKWLIDQKSDMIHITHEELANQLGSVREVISRQLKKMEKENKIKLYRGKIEILDI